MKLKKASPELVETFNSVVPGPPVERRTMFGYPCAFLNGNLFMGLHSNGMILRLSEDERIEIGKKMGAKISEPMPGRPMREYILVPTKLIESTRALAKWVDRAYAYAKSLKPKAKKPKK